MNSLIAEAPEAIARFIIASTDVTRSDRLWPTNQLAFRTNPLSIAYGACGTALFLQQVHGEIPADVRRWLLDRRVSVDEYPPGLFIGAAGIAVAFDQLGLTERALEVMRVVDRSPLRDADASFVLGIAGWGWASLYFYRRTRDSRFLDRAVMGARILLRMAERDGDTLSWRHAVDGKVHLGFGYGASGVALFLLQLGIETGDDTYVAAARNALGFDLRHAADAGLGWGWGRYPGEGRTEPYWLHGNSGVGTTLVRLYEHTGDAADFELIAATARAAQVKVSVLPSQWIGMSGIGEFLLDAHRATGDAQYRRAAEEMAEASLCFRLERLGGWAFPSPALSRLSTDYASGSAGVGAFLHRLSAGGPRLFADLPDVSATVEHRFDSRAPALAVA